MGNPGMPHAVTAALLLALLPAVAAAGETAPVRPAVVREYDVVYATVGGEKLRLDLARPKGDGPFPCVVCLHGGAWKMGSRKDLSEPFGEISFGIPGASLVEVLAARGYAAASVSYRLAPKAKFPAQITDAKTAVRFLRRTPTNCTSTRTGSPPSGSRPAGTWPPCSGPPAAGPRPNSTATCTRTRPATSTASSTSSARPT